MVDDSVEDGLGPGGRPAKLLQHHWRHTLVQGLPVTFVSDSALRKLCRCAQAGQLATKALIRSLTLPGGVWQAIRRNAQVSHADFRCAFGVRLPGCTYQGARDRAPQLGAGGPLGEGIGSTLSDKELKSVVDDSIEDGLGPGGRPAKLF